MGWIYYGDGECYYNGWYSINTSVSTTGYRWGLTAITCTSGTNPASDSDGDGVPNVYDPCPDQAGISGEIWVANIINKSTGESVGTVYTGACPDGSIFLMGDDLSGSGDIDQYITDDVFCNYYDDDPSCLYTILDSSDLSWSEYADNISNNGMTSTASVSNGTENLVDDWQYTASINTNQQLAPPPENVNNTPETPTTNGTDNQHLQQTVDNTQAMLENQVELSRYMRSIDGTLREIRKDVEDGGIYLGPSADEIGDAVSGALDGVVNGTGGPTAEEIGQAVQDKAITEGYTEPSSYQDLMPTDPGHGHGVKTRTEALGYFETKLNDWYTAWETAHDPQSFFNGTEIRVISPSSDFCIGEINTGLVSMPQQCISLASWQAPISSIGNILYGCVAIWWGLWVFMKD